MVDLQLFSLQKKAPALSLASKLYVAPASTLETEFLDSESIDAKRLKSVEDEIKAQGGTVLSVAGDVGADDFPKLIVDATVKYVPLCSAHVTLALIQVLAVHREFGKINHIINNAGFTFDKMLHTTPDETFDIILKIHVRAPFRLIRQAAPYFRLKVRIPLVLTHMQFTDITTARTKRKPIYHQRFLYFWFTWKCRTSKLCCSKSSCHRTYQDYR